MTVSSGRVLVLGAGLVARPLVRYLLEEAGLGLTVASRTLSKAERLVGGHERGRAVALDVRDGDQLERLVRDADLAISLLPYAHHVTVARLCIARGIPMVTTSYVSPEMRALDRMARDAGVLIINELGVDPGIDHMSAMKVIHDVEARGGRVVEFESCCGGLPAPEAATNPWGYKFSWSPRGVVLAARNAARYLRDGRVVEVPGPDLFTDVRTAEIPGVGTLEIYPNRDSMGYRDLYGLPDVRTLLRGTFRYPGHSRTWKALADLGWLGLEEIDVSGLTYGRLHARLIASPGRDVRGEVAARLGMDPADDPLEWLGLFGTDPVPGDRASPLDVLAGRLTEKLAYGEGERDMIVLQHRFLAELPSGDERITSTLVDFGVPGGDSSMARTVSLPAAIASRCVLEGRIRATGVHIPVMREAYEPVLAELGRLGIRMQDETVPA
jgi:saccharopine dehydrogenase-like NADP-dependent oxidoreductase